jgi:serine/threonine protein kinase
VLLIKASCVVKILAMTTKLNLQGEAPPPPFHVHFHLHSKQINKQNNSNQLESTLREPYRFIGKGGYGAVYQVRHSQTKRPLPEVLKISYCYDKETLDAFHKEVFYLEELQNITVPPIPGLSNQVPHTLAPRIFHSSVSTKQHVSHGYQIMEKLDTNMTQLGILQAKNYGLDDKCFAFTTEQFLNLLWIPLILDSIDFIHGDLKPRNICQTMQGKIQKVIDLAFGGKSDFYKVNQSDKSSQRLYDRPQLGYPSLRFRKKKDRMNPKNPPSFPPHLWKFLNRCQIYYSLVIKRQTYLIRNGTKRCELIPGELILDHLNLPSLYVVQFLNLFDGLFKGKKKKK